MGGENRDSHLYSLDRRGPITSRRLTTRVEKGVVLQLIHTSESGDLNLSTKSLSHSLLAQLEGDSWMSACMGSLTEEKVHIRLLEFVNTWKTIIEMMGQVTPNLRCTKMIKASWGERYWLHKYSELSKFRLNKLIVYNQNPNKQCDIIVFNESCLQSL